VLILTVDAAFCGFMAVRHFASARVSYVPVYM